MTTRLPRSVITATNATNSEWHCLVSPVDPSCLTDLASATAPHKAEVDALINNLQGLRPQTTKANAQRSTSRQAPRKLAGWALGAGLAAAAASTALITTSEQNIDPAGYTLIAPHMATGKNQVLKANEVVQVGPAVDIQGPATVALTQFGPNGTVLDLKDGRLFVSVDPESPFRNVIVDAGDVSVQVHGTRFLVDRDNKEVAVTVFEGDVIARFPGGARHIGAGEAFAWPPDDGTNVDDAEEEVIECDGEGTEDGTSEQSASGESTGTAGNASDNANQQSALQVDIAGQDVQLQKTKQTSANPNGQRGSAGTNNAPQQSAGSNAAGGAAYGGNAQQNGRGTTVIPGGGSSGAGGQGPGWSTASGQPSSSLVPGDEDTTGICFDPSMQWRASPPLQSTANPLSLDELEDFLAGRKAQSQQDDSTTDNASSDDPASAAFELIVERFEEQRRPNDTLEVLESWLERYPDHPMAEEGHQILLQLLVDIRSSEGS